MREGERLQEAPFRSSDRCSDRHSGGVSLSSTSRGSSGLTPAFCRAGAGRAFLEQRLRRPRERARRLPQLRQRGQPLLICLPLRHIPQPDGHQDLEQVQGPIDRLRLQVPNHCGEHRRTLRLRSPLQQRRLQPQGVPASAASRFGGPRDGFIRPNRQTPISSTHSSARANAVPVGGRRSRSDSENREPSRVFSVAAMSPGSGDHHPLPRHPSLQFQLRVASSWASSAQRTRAGEKSWGSLVTASNALMPPSLASGSRVSSVPSG